MPWLTRVNTSRRRSNPLRGPVRSLYTGRSRRHAVRFAGVILLAQ